MSSTSRLHRITKSDWALAGIGLGFSIAGLVMLPRDFNSGIVTLAVFGLCLAHAVHVILRKRRLARLGAVTARVVGGVRMRPSRLQFGLYGATLLALGITMASLASPRDAQLGGVGWLLILIGGGMLAGLAVGWLPIGHLQFDPEGLTIGDWGGQALLPWDAITGLGCNEVDGNPAVMVMVDPGALVVTPARHGRTLMRQLAWARGKAGVDFILVSHHYGIDAPVLQAALERYVVEPGARHELHPSPQIAP